MKLIKTVKQLKFWSRKKKRNKDFYQYYKLAHDQYSQPCYYSPPPPLRPAPPRLEPGPYPCYFHQPIEPSAPPLPPWLETQQSTEEGIWNGSSQVEPLTSPSQEATDEDHCISISQETVVKTTSQLLGKRKMPDASSSSYQDYEFLDSNHDLPIRPRRDQAATGRFFGCVVDIGDYIFRCFFPCFHVSERHSYHRSSGRVKLLSTIP